MNPGMGRKNGLEYPRSTAQSYVMVVYPISTIFFYILTGMSMSVLGNTVGVLVIVLHSISVVGVLSNWVCVSITDPSQTNRESSCLFKDSQLKPYYCMHCHKKVPGFDHHCDWLNTCIGTRNYAYFYFLSLFGFMQFALEVAISVVIMVATVTRMESNKSLVQLLGGKAGFYAVLVIFNFTVIVIFLAFASLWLFHTYLRCIGLNTYEWIVKQHQTHDERSQNAKTTNEVDIERKRAREREEWSKRMNDKQAKSKKSPSKGRKISVASHGDDIELPGSP